LALYTTPVKTLNLQRQRRYHSFCLLATSRFVFLILSFTIFCLCDNSYYDLLYWL